jgi:hypothetical protein
MRLVVSPLGIVAWTICLAVAHAHAQAPAPATAAKSPSGQAGSLDHLLDKAVEKEAPLDSFISANAPAPAPQAKEARPQVSVPACRGPRNDEAARAAAQVGKELFKTAIAKAVPDEEGFAAALAQFDAQCEAGDSWALEFRAYALVRLGRELEAARSLDAFLAQHDASSLPLESS